MHPGVWTFWWQNVSHNCKDLTVHQRKYLYNILLCQYFVTITQPNFLILQTEKSRLRMVIQVNSRGRSKTWAFSLNPLLFASFNIMHLFISHENFFFINEFSHQTFTRAAKSRKVKVFGFQIIFLAPPGELLVKDNQQVEISWVELWTRRKAFKTSESLLQEFNSSYLHRLHL